MKRKLNKNVGGVYTHTDNLIENKRGITLVALVITIIILLILAGITITQLTNSGLFKNIQLAKEKYEDSAEQEQNILLKTDDFISNYRETNLLYTYMATYQGSGTYGENNKNKLTFEKSPKMVVITPETGIDSLGYHTKMTFIQGNVNSYGTWFYNSSSGHLTPSNVTWSNNGKTVEWYSINSVEQMNANNMYKYIVIY